MTTIIVTARRWAEGWELWIDPENVTSVHDLQDATQQVRDYLGTVDPETDHSDIELDLRIE